MTHIDIDYIWLRQNGCLMRSDYKDARVFQLKLFAKENKQEKNNDGGNN